MSSAVTYDRDVDLTDVSHIARSGIKIGLFTADRGAALLAGAPASPAASSRPCSAR